MSSANKQTSDEKSSRIDNYFKNLPHPNISQKRLNSSLSPLENSQSTKKPNMNETPERSSLALDNLGSDQDLSENPDNNTPNSSLHQIIGPLISEVKLLRESFHKDILSMDSKLESAIEVQKSEFSKLEENITIQRKEITMDS